MKLRRLILVGCASSLLTVSGISRAQDPVALPGSYGFEAAAQEITQLMWLAETAAACEWTTEDEALRFKLFSVKFIAAHLKEAHKLALVALVTDEKYEQKLREAALEGAKENCSSRRWQLGWSSYKAAADQHYTEY